MQGQFFCIMLQLQRLLKMEEGQDLVEYGLLAAVIALGAIASVGGAGSEVVRMYNLIVTTFATDVGV